MNTNFYPASTCSDVLRQSWTMPLLIFLATLVAGSIFQGSRGLYDRDETRYAECAREMLETGNFLIPQRDFRPHLTKPPLTYWALAAGMKVFGRNEWGVRFPNTLAFAFTVLLVALIGRIMYDEDHGLLAGMVYMSMIFPFAASSIVTTDTLLVLWEVAAIWAFLAGYRSTAPSRATWWFVLMYIFWGLGFLTKGVAILPVSSSLIIFWLVNRRRFVASPLTGTGIVLFLLIGTGWYIALGLLQPGAFSVFINEQITGRLFSDSLHRNSAWYAPFYLYLPILLLGPLPWSLFWPGTIKTIPFYGGRDGGRDIPVQGNHGARAIQTLKQTYAVILAALRNRPDLQLIVLWWAVPLVVFCLARSRLPLYILPLFAPMALATAAGLKQFPAMIKGTEKPSHVLSRFTTLAHAHVFMWIAFLIALKGVSATITMPQNARMLYKKVASHLTTSTLILADCDLNLDGLAFYSGKNIEYLGNKGALCQRVDDTWTSEMAEMARDGIPRVFIVPADEPYTLPSEGSTKGIPDGAACTTNLPNDMRMVYVPPFAFTKSTDHDLAMNNIRGKNPVMANGERAPVRYMPY